jgi:hypothetical protein
MMRRARLAILVLLALLAVPKMAVADTTEDKRAEQLFTEGQAAFEAGDFRRAASSFEAAYATKHHPAVLWNAARSWQRAGEELRAAIEFDRYLRVTGADAPNRDEATKSLAEILKHVARVQIRTVGVKSATLDGEPVSETSVLVASGEHVVTGEDSAGRPVRKVFTARGGETVSIVVATEPKSEPVTTPKAEPKLESKESSRPLSPWVVVAGSVLATAGGVLTVLYGIQTVNKAHAFDADKTAARLDEGYASQMRTNVALGVTGGIVALTTIAALFLVDWGGSSPRATGRSALR